MQFARPRSPHAPLGPDRYERRRARLRDMLGLCAVLVPVLGGEAPGHPLAQHRVPFASPALQQPHIVPTGPHTFFGTIVALGSGTIMVRLRSGQLARVDATEAIRQGNYSGPLYVGKLVKVDGSLRGAEIEAAHIFSLSSIADLPADR